jgi:uncharacterized protein
LSTSRYVLDSYALIALAQDEQGSDKVDDLLAQAIREEVDLYISLINLAEVQYNLIRRRASSEQIAALESLPIIRASADEFIPQVVQLKASYPVSLADCFAAALAIELDCPLITGDPEFLKLEDLVKVEWLT